MKNSKNLVKVSSNAKGIQKITGHILCPIINALPYLTIAVLSIISCGIFAVIFAMMLGLRW